MSMIRSTLMTLIDEIADANNSPRWGTTLKRQMLGEVHWREWRDLLNVNKMLRVGSRTVTTDANGRVAKSDLNTGLLAQDNVETFYRVLSVRLGNFFYQPAKYDDYPVSPTSVALPQVWYEYGDGLQLIPAVEGNTATIVVNHLPQRADLLSSDSSTVVFPDGYEMVLAYETAASMFMKGAAETNLSMELSGKASQLRDLMHQDVSRLTIRPIRMGYADDRMDWGST